MRRRDEKRAAKTSRADFGLLFPGIMESEFTDFSFRFPVGRIGWFEV
jgi:hypothetical protein